MPSLEDGVAVVTGGCSGIGAAIVAALKPLRSAVVAMDLAAPEDDLSSDTPVVGVDVSDREQVQDALSRIERELGPVTTLVNCAGVAAIAPASELDDPGWEWTLRVNLTGTFLTSQCVLPQMRAAGVGRIVNIASQAATIALHDHAAYAASKAGVLGLSRVLALEWGPLGVTVNTVSPTVVLTELSRPNWDNPKGDALREQIPTGRFAEPEEVAATVVFVASDAAGMINGTDLMIDGGYSIR